MLDWDDLRFFLEVARLGTLTSAAERLRVTQSTVSRRLASLEIRLGVRLLNRTPSGYLLTNAGSSVLERVQRLEEEAIAVVRSVARHDARVAGHVTIACIESVATKIIIPRLTEIHRKHPEISIGLLLETRHLSLSRRDADISIRLFQPNEQDVIGRRIGSVRFGLYANKSYLEKIGHPDFGTHCAGHAVVTFADDLLHLPQAQWLSEIARGASVVLRANNYQARFDAALAGAGLACLPCFHADAESSLCVLEPQTSAPEQDLWIAMHEDNRNTQRVRTIVDVVTAAIRAALKPPKMHNVTALATGAGM